MNDTAPIREEIERLVAEEHDLLAHTSPAGLDSERHERLAAVRAELDSCWDMLRRREAGQRTRLADADVPDPPNEFEGPDPEPPHQGHGVHEDGPH